MQCLFDNERKEIKFFYYGMILLLATYLLMSIWGNNSIFADGVYYFSNIIETKGFCIIEPGNEIFEMLRQLFCVVGIKLGISNIKILNYLYSFGCLYLQIIFTMLSMNLCIRNKKYSYFYLTILCMSLQIVFTGFFVMMGYISFTMICFYAFLYLLFYNNETRKISKICFTLFCAVIFLRAGSIFLFLGMLMIILILYRIIIEKTYIDIFYVVNMIICILGCFSALNTIINPRDPSNKSGYLNSIMNYDKSVYIIFLILFLAVAFSMLMVIIKKRRCKMDTFFKILSILLQIISGIVFFYYICKRSYVISINSYNFRSLNLIISFSVLFYILFLEVFSINLHDNIYKYCNIFFLIAALVFVFISTINYNYHLKYLNDRLINSKGYVEINEIVILEHNYFWGWTNSLESLYAQIICDRLSIKAVITNGQDFSGWQPFDGKNINNYPNLQYYGVMYDDKYFLK